MKQCASCGIEKPLDAFYRDRRYLDNPPRGSCKECINRRQRTPKKQVRPVPKPCVVCGIVKPPHEFVKDPRHSDGLRADCKQCFYSPAHYAVSQRWRHANPERIRTYNRRTQPQRHEWGKKWREANPEAAARLSRLTKDRMRAKDPVGFRTKIQLRTERRRARKKSNGLNDLTRRQWEDIKAAYGHCCAYCGKKHQRLTIDHVVPLVRGGHHTAANVVPACRSCNCKKHDKPAPTHQPHLIQ